MPADLPPIETRWGDLTEAQREALPVGTVLGPPPNHQEWGTLTRVRGGWLSWGEDSYLLDGAEVLRARPIISYPDPRPSTVTVTLTPALYARALAAGMPEGECAIGEWLVSRAEVAAAADRGVYPHTTFRRAGVTAFCRCGHVAQTDATTWGDDCPITMRAALATARADALEEAAQACEGLGRDFAEAFPKRYRRTLSVIRATCNDAAFVIRNLTAKKEAP